MAAFGGFDSHFLPPSISETKVNVVALVGLPSVDSVLKHSEMRVLIDAHGRTLVKRAVHEVLDEFRGGQLPASPSDFESMARMCERRIAARLEPSLRPVFNLTGTVLHTNLGRAVLPESACEAVLRAARSACNLEFGTSTGRRGERDDHFERLLCELTGAEAATAVNNNAAAVFLLLNTLAARKEVVVSRGELVEIGGSFRMPQIMAAAGCKLREVGTTNRTHLADYQQGINRRTGLLMKVHPSNYTITGFTSDVDEATIAKCAHAAGIPFAVDIGSGALVDFSKFGLERESRPMDTLAHGADVVTFSGDKLVGGPQAGMIIGRKELIDRIRKNPLKRVLRLDKLRIAALEAVLAIYQTPELLSTHLPTLRFLTRPTHELERLAECIAGPLQRALGDRASVEVRHARCQVGSGSLPSESLPSVALAIVPCAGRRGRVLHRIAHSFRALPIPVVGRIEKDVFVLDLRCLEDTQRFLDQLQWLELP